MSSWQSRATALMLRTIAAGSRVIKAEEDAAAWRARMDGAAKRAAKLDKTTRTGETTAGTRPARWVEGPDSHAHRVIYYLHGGGYVFGSPDTHQGLVARLAGAARARALILDYRLAPEHPYPAGLEDALNGYRWLLSNGIPPEEIVVAGDSAGGGLTLALLMALRDHKDEMPAAGVLLSPWTDLALTGWSIIANEPSEALLSVRMLTYCAQLYLKGLPPTDPFASPHYGDLTGLPPLLVHTAEGEMLHDDGLRIAKKAEAAGVDVTYESFDTVLHVPHFFAGVPEGKAAVERAGAFIRQATGGTDVWREEVEAVRRDRGDKAGGR